MKDAKVATTAPAELTRAATALHKAFAAPDASAAAAGMHTDVVFTDMALRTQVIGRIETVRYLDRVLGRVPTVRAALSATSSAGPMSAVSSGPRDPAPPG